MDKKLRWASILLGGIMALSMASCIPVEYKSSNNGSSGNGSSGGVSSDSGSSVVDVVDTEIFSGRQSVLLMGQSNMSGRGKLNSVNAIEDERIFMQQADLTWTQMAEPIHYDKNIAGVGLAASFADAFVNTFEVEVGLVPCAVGGTSIDQWAVGGDFYNATLERARAAQADSEICAILWHQGCSNENNYEGYAEKFRTIMNTLMSDLELDAEKIIIVSGELGTFRETAGGSDIDGITDELYRIGDYYDNYAVTSSVGLTAVDVHTHFDGPSQRVFGYRYFANYYNILTGRTFNDFSEKPEDYIKASLAGFFEAEDYNSKSGSGYKNGDASASAGYAIGYTKNGDYAVYNNVYFDGTPTAFAVSCGGPGSEKGIELCIDDLDTTLAKLDVVPPSPAGSYSTYGASIVEITYNEELTGYHDIYLKYNEGYNVDWFEFITGNIFTVEPTNSSVTEGDTAEIVVTRWGSSTSERSVTVETVAGSAVDGVCYTGYFETVTFVAGETEKTISIPTMDTEFTDNGNVSFNVVLSNPSIGSALFTKLCSISVDITTSMQKVFVSEDTYVQNGSETNFGSAGSVDFKEQSNSTQRIGYMKFDISELTLEEYQSVEIVLYLNRHDGNGGYIYIHKCVNDWDEMTMKWSNKVAVGAEIGSGASYKNQNFRLDVTEYVKAALANGDTEISFALVGPYNAYVGVDSREAGTGREAYLLVK